RPVAHRELTDGPLLFDVLLDHFLGRPRWAGGWRGFGVVSGHRGTGDDGPRVERYIRGVLLLLDMVNHRPAGRPAPQHHPAAQPSVPAPRDDHARYPGEDDYPADDLDVQEPGVPLDGEGKNRADRHQSQPGRGPHDCPSFLGRVPAGDAAAGLFAWFWAEHAATQVAERACEQSGHVHLGDAEPVPDLGLGHVAVEAHHEQALLALGEVAPVGPHRLHVERVLELRVILAEQVGQVPRLGPGRARGIQRGGVEGQVGALSVAHAVVADTQPLSQLRVLRCPGQLLGQLGAHPAQLEPQLLGRALDVHTPALVPEMPLDLAGDARLGVGRQVAAEVRIEVVDGFEQAYVPDLHQLFG